MKYGFIAILVTLFFIAGFFTSQRYPLTTASQFTALNATHTDKQPGPGLQPDSSTASDSTSEDNAPEVISQTMRSAQLTDTESGNTDSVHTGNNATSEPPLQAAQSDKVTATLAQAEQQLAAEKYPMAQQEFEYWHENHLRELKERMREALGEDADWMFKEVSEDNSLLTNPVANTPLETDLAWRQRTEQALSDLLYAANTDPDFKLQGVSCIQKQCEVTITGANQAAGIRLFMQLATQKPNGINSASQPTFFSKPDHSYWLYFTLQFA
ncbi:hypothetical protein [Alteromonas gilva]|uniref:SCP domain-containing protein n=1 Tax=Alteromonas gilva TaxID=2987522 RepID=A0ABT5L550_9ALTE|nr:hypothetical protein [Alteromonas gilva]MDC8832003.1 hypothetical protein [Alteromonas gilva]